ncbi:MAG: hypothetical protein KME27_20870 [Lyngbya sp. HA4199-MV5]|jgi:hypothetical protein|nr:hypothetical protein [Lyngbya sp. HA4199-MV5]
MKLVIREYLSMLKEAGELDSLLFDLLMNMKIIPLNRAESGGRQDGVDIPAIGNDPEDGRRKLFLFTAKCGDITRQEWDAAPNGIRASLNEILEGYLRTRVRPGHAKLPKKIVLVTGGALKQNVAQNWTNYVHEHTQIHSKYGEIEFEFWGGEELAPKIEDYLLDEYLFPESSRKNLRKTIALVDQNEDQPKYFYQLIDETLLSGNLPTDKKPGSVQKRRKALRLLHLSLSIIFHWGEEANNLRPAFLSAEYMVLRAWDWLRRNNLFECKKTMAGFIQLFFTYLTVGDHYAGKLQPYCYVQDGLFGYNMADEVEYPLRTFETIGTLASIGLSYWYIAQILEGETQQRYFDQASAIARMLENLIKSNPSAWTPLYDSHAIDIALGLLALTAANDQETAIEWVHGISSRIFYAYDSLGRHFPIASDSHEELIALEFGKAPPKEALTKLSTLLPLLADWFAILKLDEQYPDFYESVVHIFSHTNLQIWFPDNETENYLYCQNAGYVSGLTVDSIQLPPTLDELKTFIINLREQKQEFRSFSCFSKGYPALGLVASRHFRTPVIPAYWQYDVKE